MSRRTFGSAIPDRVKEVWQHQADATLSQASPVSTTWYTVLDTKTNVRIIYLESNVTWTVQPSPLEIRVTIDGNVLAGSQANPASAQAYFAWLNRTEALQFDTTDYLYLRTFILEGRSVKVEVRTTGGTTSNLSARVKYALMI